VSPARRSSRTLPVRLAAARFIVLTGLSGAGKSQAVRALEDLGFFCVDNLPTSLIPTFADLTLRTSEAIPKAAVVVDVREGRFLKDFPRIYERLRRKRALKPVLIFLEATDKALVRRFSETRRPHPLARHRSALEGIVAEREQLAPIRRMADAIIDTSNLNVHELRQAFLNLSTENADRALLVTIESFGYKYGVPVDADLVFDVRFLPNPHFVRGLRTRTGRDRSVRGYLDEFPAVHEFERRLDDFLAFLVPQYATEGKTYLTIGIGCTGGRHRSVAIAERLKAGLLSRLDGVQLRVRHRDISRE
jgi:UPF0042 nucleotide-binding protein